MNSQTRRRVQTINTYWAWAASFNALLFGALIFAATALADDRPVILAIGDSLTAGYGLPPGKSFPDQLELALRGEGVDAKVVNGGVSGDTSAGGLARLEWLLEEKPDLVILELGANDGMRGLDPVATKDNLDRIIARVQESGAHILLAGMVAPPNMGSEYGKKFNAIYPDLAKRHGTAFYPFFLDGVAMDPSLNQQDGIHPTAEGVAVIVKRMLPIVNSALAEAER